MVSLREYITRHDTTRRPSRISRRHVRERAGDVSVMRSPGLDTASVALPADIDLEDRATRMNEFWEKLVDYQHRDVLVVALAVAEEL